MALHVQYAKGSPALLHKLHTSVPPSLIGGLLFTRGHCVALINRDARLYICDSSGREFDRSAVLDVPSCVPLSKEYFGNLGNDWRAFLIFANTMRPYSGPILEVKQKYTLTCVSASIYVLLLNSPVLDFAPDSKTKRDFLQRLQVLRYMPGGATLPTLGKRKFDNIPRLLRERSDFQNHVETRACPIMPKTVVELYNERISKDWIPPTKGVNWQHPASVEDLFLSVMQALQLDVHFYDEGEYSLIKDATTKKLKRVFNPQRMWRHYAKLAS